jgi:catechol 2,3-dioxygenase-like lactoylglutathione lyase family enzyme
MTDVSEPRTATITGAEPQLYVCDIAAALHFYQRTLGFSVAFSYGDPPFYAQVFRGGARLNLRHVDAPPIDPALREHDQLLAATITLDDANPLFAEYQAAGVDFAQTLRAEPWGAHTFIVRDPDGNLLLFAGGG